LAGIERLSNAPGAKTYSVRRLPQLLDPVRGDADDFAELSPCPGASLGKALKGCAMLTAWQMCQPHSQIWDVGIPYRGIHES
jgi:hypothetical protein